MCAALHAEREAPPPALTQACLVRMEATGDALFAVPAIGGVDAKRAGDLLARLVALCKQREEDPANAPFKDALVRLLLQRPQTGAAHSRREQ